MHTALLSALLGRLAKELAADPANASAWSQAAAAIEVVRAAEPELARIVDAKDAGALAALVAAWSSGATLLPEHDRATLKARSRRSEEHESPASTTSRASAAAPCRAASGRASSPSPRPPLRAGRVDELVRQGSSSTRATGSTSCAPAPKSKESG
jgi:hypothetical protein